MPDAPGPRNCGHASGSPAIETEVVYANKSSNEDIGLIGFNITDLFFEQEETERTEFRGFVERTLVR
jgi:hypothetical protein